MKKNEFGILMSLNRKKSVRKTKLEIKKWDSKIGNIREIMEYLKLRKKSNKYNKNGTDKKSTRISMTIKKKTVKNASKLKNENKKLNANFLTNIQNSRFLKKHKSIEVFKKKKSKNVSILKKNTSFNNLFILDQNLNKFMGVKIKNDKKKSVLKKKRKKFLMDTDLKKTQNYISNSYNKHKMVKKYLSIDPENKNLKKMNKSNKYNFQSVLASEKNQVKSKLDNLKKGLQIFFNKYKNFQNENDALKRENNRYKILLKKQN